MNDKNNKNELKKWGNIFLQEDKTEETLKRLLIITCYALIPLLVIMISLSSSLLWFRLLPRLCLGAGLGCVFICILQPKWCLPLFIISMGPLQTFSGYASIMIGDYPFALFSLAIWGLALFWIARKPYFRKIRPSSLGVKLGSGGWWLLLLISLPALFLGMDDPFSGTMTKVILIRGPLEALVVFCVAKSWMRNYNDISSLVFALCISIFVGFFFGMSNYTSVLVQSQRDNLYDIRFNLSALGGANFLGFYLVILFPLIFTIYKKIGTFHSVLILFSLFGMSVASFSRSTPVAMAFQLIVFVFFKKTRKLAMLTMLVIFLVSLVARPFIPSQVVSTWVDRWYSSDAIGLIFGDAKRLDNSDAIRLQMKQNYWYELPNRPFGGYGNPDEDPENIYLDIALQLGWGAGIALVTLQLFLFLMTARRAWTGIKGKDDFGIALFVAVVGEVIYCYVTGVNMVKYLPSQDSSTVTVNSVPAVYFAFFTVLCLLPYQHYYKKSKNILTGGNKVYNGGTHQGKIIYKVNPGDNVIK